MSHITRLQAENIKKLRVLDIRPGTTAGVVPIRGRNAQGKSSTLDAIQMALGGSKFTPSRPIRTGEDEAAIRLELDTGEVILRRFTADGNDTLEFTNGAGFKAGSPQLLLNKLFASVAFDPLAFTRLKPAEQLETLRKQVTLDVDVDALTKANDDDYTARRDKNRELERESQKLDQMPTYPDLAKAAKEDEAALEQQIATAAETNGGIERRRVRREQFAGYLESNRQRLTDIERQIADMKAELAALEQDRDDFANTVAEQEKQVAEAEALPEPVDVSDVQTKLREAREKNRRIDANKQADAQMALVAILKTESAELTEAMDERKKQITDAISRAEMPVPGLGFGDGEVLFGGVPLDQASSAEQLRVSTAIGIASSPTLRVMLVRDGSLLDDEGEQILADLAAAHDFQLWVEAVDTSGTVGIVLEDGAVISIDGEAPPEPEGIAKPKRRAKKPTAEIEASVPSGDGDHVGGGADGTAPNSGGDVSLTRPDLAISTGEERVNPDDAAPWADDGDATPEADRPVLDEPSEEPTEPNPDVNDKAPAPSFGNSLFD